MGKGHSNGIAIKEETQIFGRIDPNTKGRSGQRRGMVRSQYSCWFMDPQHYRTNFENFDKLFIKSR